jgi:hypothetical protein
MPVRSAAGPALSPEDFWTIARSHRSPHRSSGRGIPRHRQYSHGRRFRGDPRSRGTRTRTAAGALSSDTKTNCNARMDPAQIKQHCKLSDESQELIRVAMTELNLSARVYDRILKVSRAVADLAASDAITPEHVSEAIQYRTFDRTLWV